MLELACDVSAMSGVGNGDQGWSSTPIKNFRCSYIRRVLRNLSDVLLTGQSL